ncbi:unnamed protein product [Clonostachys rosea]|uniref:Uncharacterized protein n=1 Tax=Bionectria ochroleuca TaxID=29856 RepID=A0ABY6U4V8_BIOOC|nr:unnamed protein product [Clonostachys rosea]
MQDSKTMPTVYDRLISVVLDDFYAYEQKAGQQHKRLVPSTPQLPDGGVVVHKGELVRVQPAQLPTLAREVLVERANGNDGVSYNGFRVAQLQYEIGPKVAIVWPRQRPGDSGTEEIQSPCICGQPVDREKPFNL